MAGRGSRMREFDEDLIVKMAPFCEIHFSLLAFCPSACFKWDFQTGSIFHASHSSGLAFRSSSTQSTHLPEPLPTLSFASTSEGKINKKPALRILTHLCGDCEGIAFLPISTPHFSP